MDSQLLVEASGRTPDIAAMSPSISRHPVKPDYPLVNTTRPLNVAS